MRGKSTKKVVRKLQSGGKPSLPKLKDRELPSSTKPKLPALPSNGSFGKSNGPFGKNLPKLKDRELPPSTRPKLPALPSNYKTGGKVKAKGCKNK
jgi:hypothetical protein